MSSVPISLGQLRKMVRYTRVGNANDVINSNAKRESLVFFTSPLLRDKILGIYQQGQRYFPTSGRVGFEGEVTIDGVPIVEDPDINTDDVFLIDTSMTKIGVNIGPVVEELPIAVDGRTAHIKIYWNLYSEAPSNNFWAHTFDTTDP